MEKETFKIFVEYTDTFGGEPNYCWVRRETLELPVGLSDRAIMRRLRKAMRLTGIKGRWIVFGDAWKFRPYKCQTILMANVVY